MKWISFALCLLPLFANAYVGSVSAGSGNAGTASIEASDTPYTNPAGIPFLQGYYFTAGFGQAKSSGNGTAQDLAVSITDNMRDTVVPTSLAYNQTHFDSDVAGEIFRRQIQLGFGNFLREGLGFGLGILHQDDRLPEDSYSQTNLTLGTLWAPTTNLGFALKADTVIPPNKNVDREYRLSQVTSAGFAYNYRKFVRAKLDVSTDSGNSLNLPRLMVGLESYMNKWLILRIGTERNNEEQYNLYTAGLGFIGPRFGLHYAFQNSPDDVDLTRHSVDLAIPIW